MGRAPARSGVARLEGRFRLLPWAFTRVQQIWYLFAFMDVPRRIARERVPTIEGLLQASPGVEHIRAIVGKTRFDLLDS